MTLLKWRMPSNLILQRFAKQQQQNTTLVLCLFQNWPLNTEVSLFCPDNPHSSILFKRDPVMEKSWKLEMERTETAIFEDR